jgi:hypothetical protein
MPSKRNISKKTNTKRRTAKRKSRRCKKRVKKNMICFSSKNKKMTKKMKRIGKRLLKTKGIKVSRCSKKRLTSAKKRKSKKLKKKKRSKRKRSAKGMPTKPVEIDIGDIDTGNLETHEPTPEDTALQPVAQNAIAFPTFSDDGNDITINVDGNQETVKENKGLNFKELRQVSENIILNRYRYSDGFIYKSDVQLYKNDDDDDDDVLTIIDMNDRGKDFIQPEDFICNYGEADQSFCYTHGHARDMPNKNVDVYEIPQN